MSIQPLSDRVLAGEPRAVARAISLIENDSPDAPAVIRHLFGQTGSAQVIGVTGPPGVGKSTLVDGLTKLWRREGRTVGILAVDPTSPFSGGAVLGDRIRMQSHSGDGGVFVRSMATRGHLGGLAHATADAAVVLDAAGFDLVVIETVGVGQAEVDIARTADVAVVVTVPGTGDDVQAIKAGIMEIADVFVVNKADREGADRAVQEIQAALLLKEVPEGAWCPPVLKTIAASGEGLPELVDVVRQFTAHPHDGARSRERAEVRLREALQRLLAARFDNHAGARPAIQEAVERIANRDVDPYTAASQILEQFE